MCGRYYFTRVSEDEKLDAVNKYMEKNYPGEYKTGEIFPGDIVPAVIDDRRCPGWLRLSGLPG